MKRMTFLYRLLLASTIISIIMIGFSFTQEQAANRVKPPIINRTTLKNGLQILTIEHHELPVVAMSVMLKSGSLHDPEGKAGCADMCAEMVRLGTKTKSSIDIANAFDSLGARLNIATDWDALFINAQSLSADFEKVTALLSDIILNPSFPEDELKLLKERRIAELTRNLDNPSYLAGTNFSKVLFKGYPYEFATEGDAETIHALKMEDLKKFYAEFFIPNNSIICIVGDIDPKKTAKIIGKHFDGWKTGKGRERNIPPVKKPQGIHIRIINKPDLTQSQIRIGHLGAPRNTEDYFAIQVMNYIFGGGSFSSRLMQIIRAERGYTYGIRSSFDWRKNAGPFLISSFTVNKQVKNLIVETLEIADDIIKNGVKEDELSNAKNFYVGNYALQFETPSQIANQILTIELYDLGTDYIEKYQDNIEAVTLDDVKKAASRYLDTKNLIISVAGNAGEIREDMDKLGKVEVIDIQ